jgi:hypothetical protein
LPFEDGVLQSKSLYVILVLTLSKGAFHKFTLKHIAFKDFGIERELARKSWGC